MKNTLLLLFLIFMVSCSCHGCGECTDGNQEPDKIRCEKSEWHQLPLTVAITDEIQFDAIKEINDFFGTEVFTPFYKELNDTTSHDIEIQIMKTGPQNLKLKTLDWAITNVYCDTDKKEVFGAIIIFKKSRYGDDKTKNILIHELFHSLNYQHHEEGIMCAYNWDDDQSFVDLYEKSDGLKKFLKDKYGLERKIIDPQ